MPMNILLFKSAKPATKGRDVSKEPRDRRGRWTDTKATSVSRAMRVGVKSLRDALAEASATAKRRGRPCIAFEKDGGYTVLPGLPKELPATWYVALPQGKVIRAERKGGVLSHFAVNADGHRTTRTPSTKRKVRTRKTTLRKALSEWGFDPLEKSSPRVSDEDVTRVARKLRVKFDAFTREAFHRGMTVELEHQDVTHGDLVATAKIALAHLHEDPRYYEKLARMEKSVVAAHTRVVNGKVVPVQQYINTVMRHSPPSKRSVSDYFTSGQNNWLFPSGEISCHLGQTHSEAAEEAMGWRPSYEPARSGAMETLMRGAGLVRMGYSYGQFYVMVDRKAGVTPEQMATIERLAGLAEAHGKSFHWDYADGPQTLRSGTDFNSLVHAVNDTRLRKSMTGRLIALFKSRVKAHQSHTKTGVPYQVQEYTNKVQKKPQEQAAPPRASMHQRALEVIDDAVMSVRLDSSLLVQWGLDEAEANLGKVGLAKEIMRHAAGRPYPMGVDMVEDYLRTAGWVRSRPEPASAPAKPAAPPKRTLKMPSVGTSIIDEDTGEVQATVTKAPKEYAVLDKVWPAGVWWGTTTSGKVFVQFVHATATDPTEVGSYGWATIDDFWDDSIQRALNCAHQGQYERALAYLGESDRVFMTGLGYAGPYRPQNEPHAFPDRVDDDGIVDEDDPPAEWLGKQYAPPGYMNPRTGGYRSQEEWVKLTEEAPMRAAIYWNMEQERLRLGLEFATNIDDDDDDDVDDDESHFDGIDGWMTQPNRLDPPPCKVRYEVGDGPKVEHMLTTLDLSLPDIAGSIYAGADPSWSVECEVSFYGGLLALQGRGTDKDGNFVFERTFTIGGYDDGDGNALINFSREFFDVAKAHQGHGFAKASDAAIVRMAEAVKRAREGDPVRIGIHANISVGGYAWARAGYNFCDPDGRDEVVSEFVYLAKTALGLEPGADRGQFDEPPPTFGISKDDPNWKMKTLARIQKDTRAMSAPQLADYGSDWGMPNFRSGHNGPYYPPGSGTPPKHHFGKAAMLGSDWSAEIWVGKKPSRDFVFEDDAIPWAD